MATKPPNNPKVGKPQATPKVGTKSSPARASGSLKDPFSKWEDGSTRGVAKVLNNMKSMRDKHRKAVSRVEALRHQLSTASGPEAREIKGFLKDTLKELAETAKMQRTTSTAVKDLAMVRTETTGKLAALRTWMMNNELTVTEKRKAGAVKKSLESVIQSLAASKIDTIDFEALDKTLDKLKTQQATLPKMLSEKFEASEDTLDLILQKQKEAQEFLTEHKKMLRAFGSSILSGMGRLAMSVSDRIGVGPFTVGNALRGVGAVGKGMMAAGRFTKNLMGGQTYMQKYMRAKKDAGPGDPQDSLTGKLADAMEKVGVQNSWFHRRLIRELEKQGRDKKNGGEGSILGKIGLMLGTITESIGKFFGSGGFLRTVASIGRWLAPLATAGQFLLTRALPIVGAFMGGWKIGSLIYEKYSEEIQDAIEVTINALSAAYKWVTEKVGSVIGGVQKFAADPAGTVKAGAKAAYSSVLDTAQSVGSTISGKVSSALGMGSATPAVAAKPAPMSAGPSMGPGSVGTAQAGPSLQGGAANLNSLVGPVITKNNSDVDLQGLSPGMQNSMGQMAQDYFAATGKKLQVNSGYRSNELQEKLYRSMPAGMAAAPGSSLHNYGLAVDVQSAQANELDKLGLLKKYGFVRPIRNEPWHLQPEGVSLAAAKSGIYSADAPSNQSAAASATPSRPSSLPPAPGPMPTGGAMAGGPGGQGQAGGTQVAGSKPVGLNDIPTHDMSDGLLVALNLGVMG